MIPAVQLKRGQVIKLDDGLWKVTDMQWVKPGKGPAYIQVKVKNVRSGASVEKRLRSAEKVEVAFFENVQMQYLYASGDEYWFMHPVTYEQTALPRDLVEEALAYLVPNTVVTVQYLDKEPVGIELPAAIELKVTETEPAVKGQTATNQYKPATLETGLKVTIPPFVNAGETVKIDTRNGEYLGRA